MCSIVWASSVGLVEAGVADIHDKQFTREHSPPPRTLTHSLGQGVLSYTQVLSPSASAEQEVQLKNKGLRCSYSQASSCLLSTSVSLQQELLVESRNRPQAQIWTGIRSMLNRMLAHNKWTRRFAGSQHTHMSNAHSNHQVYKVTYQAKSPRHPAGSVPNTMRVESGD